MDVRLVRQPVPAGEEGPAEYRVERMDGLELATLRPAAAAALHDAPVVIARWVDHGPIGKMGAYSVMVSDQPNVEAAKCCRADG